MYMQYSICVISGFLRGVNEIVCLLEFYAVNVGSYLITTRANISLFYLQETVFKMSSVKKGPVLQFILFMRVVNSVKHCFTYPAIPLIFAVEFYVPFSFATKLSKIVTCEIVGKELCPPFSPALRLFGVQPSVSRKRRFVKTELIRQKNLTN